ncbi:MAG: hypothetical protein H5U36_03315, partial [Candidatus Caldatribacterium sp.]|nr:hypothetical protein [Candidatus Caldatribacterium sp.]
KVAIEQYAQIPEIIPIQYKLKNYAAMQAAYAEDIAPGLLGEISIEEAVAKLEKDLERLLEE